MPTLHWWIGASSVSPYVMIVTWWTASGIILHHRSNAYELFTYCSSLIYFSVATVTITKKYQKHYFCCLYFCYRYHHYHITLLLNILPQILSLSGVVELTTQLLILENILWLPLCRINKFGLNTLPSKTVAIPYTCGFSDTYVSVPFLSLGSSTVRSNPLPGTSSHCKIYRSRVPKKTQISEKKYKAIRDRAYKRSKKLK